jgi:hypothetical protein
VRPPDMLFLQRLQEGLWCTVVVCSPQRISRWRTLWARLCCTLEAKVGPWKHWKKTGAAACRIPYGRARTRRAFWTVPLRLSFCPILFPGVRVTNPRGPREIICLGTVNGCGAFRAAQRQCGFPAKHGLQKKKKDKGADLYGLEHIRGWQVA